jgi:hypothetical protein
VPIRVWGAFGRRAASCHAYEEQLSRHSRPARPHGAVRQRPDPATPPVTLVRLAGDESWRVRRNVAGNLAAPLTVLERLADDAIARVRIRLAANPSCSAAVLTRLAADAAPLVRARVLVHPTVAA